MVWSAATLPNGWPPPPWPERPYLTSAAMTWSATPWKASTERSMSLSLANCAKVAAGTALKAASLGANTV